MIVTLTANPSLDRTVTLPEALVRGRVQRALSVTTHPGGKGVNVARVVTAAGQPAVAVLPAADGDPFSAALRDEAVPARVVAVTSPVRTNLTIAEPDGTTTKVNEPGSPLSPAVLDALADTVSREAVGARWAVLSGSVPPGVPASWYAGLVARLSAGGTAVALDTSGAPLAAALAAGVDVLPDLLKPNGQELAELVGWDGRDLEEHPDAAATAAASLVDRGVGAVLVTLGARGALLVTLEGVWSAEPPPVVARSSVGAGDSALAGYLLAELAGAPPAERLRSAVAYGTAAAALPGSALPGPGDASPAGVRVVRLEPVVTP